MDSQLTPEVLSSVVDAVLTWAIVGVYRWKFPRQWQRMDSRKLRLGIVALTAIVVAIGGGIFSGAGPMAIVKSAIVAFAGAIAMRQTTKRPVTSMELPNHSRPLSIRTKPMQRGE